MGSNGHFISFHQQFRTIYSQPQYIFIHSMQEQNQVNQEKQAQNKNDQAPQINKTQKQQQQFFTISWSVVQETTPGIQPTNKNRTLDSSYNQSQPGILPHIDNKPKIHQTTNNLKNISIHKQFLPSQLPLNPSQQLSSESHPINPFSRKQFSPSSIFEKPINFPPDFTKPSLFSTQTPLKRTQLIPSQFLHLLSEKEIQSYAKQQNSRMSLNPWQPRPIEPAAKHLTQELIRLSVRSQLIRRSRKYQISTNNAHKKYINCLKNLFYEALSQEQITDFETKYIKQKSSRAFFFIILVYVKYRFTNELGNAVKTGFQRQMNDRIKEYEEQAYQCRDQSLKNYREEQIKEIRIAIKAVNQFYAGNTNQAIEYLYRKDKRIIIKQNHYRASLKSIYELEVQYSNMNEPKISKPFPKEHYHKKLKRLQMDQNYEKENQFCHNSKEEVENNDQMCKISKKEMLQEAQVSGGKDASWNRNEQHALEKNQSFEKENSQKESDSQKEAYHQLECEKSDKPFIRKEDDSGPSNQGSQLPSEQIRLKMAQETYLGRKVVRPRFDEYEYLEQEQMREMDQMKEMEVMRETTQMDEILFPPIPPYFYLREFDEKYGYLFRKLAYVKAWRQASEHEQFIQEYHQKDPTKVAAGAYVPAPLAFTKRPFFSLGGN